MNDTAETVELNIDRIASPVGRIALVMRDRHIVTIQFNDHWDGAERNLKRRFGEFHLNPITNPHGNSDCIRRYFDGVTDAFDNCLFDTGGTDFQQRVWKKLPDIGWGKTLSYGELADQINRPKASRAVGAANGQNPISLALPCHRVIGADGTLTGYGGGLKRKQWLLAHEAGVQNGELFA